MSKPVRALVTNDDGISSEGIRQLALAAVDAGLDVVVAAPLHDSSGSSSSLTAVESDGHIVVVRVCVSDIEAQFEPGTDAALVNSGYVTVTALQSICEAPDVALPVARG
jgi:5'/3'-nucleotidase SurE